MKMVFHSTQQEIFEEKYEKIILFTTYLINNKFLLYARHYRRYWNTVNKCTKQIISDDNKCYKENKSGQWIEWEAGERRYY